MGYSVSRSHIGYISVGVQRDGVNGNWERDTDLRVGNIIIVLATIGLFYGTTGWAFLFFWRAWFYTTNGRHSVPIKVCRVTSTSYLGTNTGSMLGLGARHTWLTYMAQALFSIS